ncbi:LysM peptidoglycan-binding domain-containing protein [Niallia taxi]|uniref:LysM peptidoglycan-binding domain-containing protein n=1 Tax=Niallia taxi TaxID=2499688 RepID=UPI0011A8C0E4|nr:LysM peptidoglycan-binding domain-containing protein [Niallia taxi]MCT2344998.1 LysM peptidoglycan-binding domain-containing protein [Niallia taxi]
MTVHVVESGENLWSISARYSIDINTIITTNGLLTPASIVPGLALYIPDDTLPVRSYKVKSGDSLWNIAQSFNTSISSITAANPGVNLSTLKIDQVLNIPSATKLSISTIGFILPSNTVTDLATINALANELTYIAIANYSFTAQGYAYVQADDTALITRCKQLNTIPLLMIRNFTSAGFDAALAGAVLENATYRQNLVASIVNLAATRGFGGVSLDLEFVPPARRQEFNSFILALKQQLGTLILQVNVHAKTADLPTNRIVGGYDYAFIGNTADLMAVMTLDYGYPGGPPDAVSPIGFVEQVVAYALSLVSPQKLLIAMALYGYDKEVSTNVTKGLSVLAAQNNAISLGVTIQYDTVAQSPWYQYFTGTMEHIVWFEDIRSFMEKYKLIDRNQLAGTTFWQINLPAPQNWAYLRREITIIK